MVSFNSITGQMTEMSQLEKECEVCAYLEFHI